jgi:hypothetical protein
MHHIARDVRGFTGTQDSLLAIHPLLGDPALDVDDLLHRRMPVKLMGASRRHPDPDEEKLLGVGQSRPREPFVRPPGRALDLHLGGGDEAAGRARHWCSTAVGWCG